MRKGERKRGVWREARRNRDGFLLVRAREFSQSP